MRKAVFAAGGGALSPFLLNMRAEAAGKGFRAQRIGATGHQGAESGADPIIRAEARAFC